jgi:uncharacterized protein (DUF305 family)
MHKLITTGLLAAAFTAGCQASGSVTATPGASGAPSPAASAAPTASDADRAFIDGMVPHHEMAVMMADDALAKAAHQELKDFATKVKADQGKEIAEMKAWRQTWFGSATTPAMDHGMMGQGTLAAGADFDRRWADEMVKHHQGAITMAQTALAATTRAEVKALAQRIIDAQQAEINQLQGWSRAWAQ